MYSEYFHIHLLRQVLLKYNLATAITTIYKMFILIDTNQFHHYTSFHSLPRPWQPLKRIWPIFMTMEDLVEVHHSRARDCEAMRMGHEDDMSRAPVPAPGKATKPFQPQSVEGSTSKAASPAASSEPRLAFFAAARKV